MLAAGAIAVLLGGCGETAAQKATKVRHKQQAAERAQWHREYAACTARLQPLTKALLGLEGHIQVGLAYPDYSARVGDLNATYSETNFQGLAGSCLQVGEALESADQEYVKIAASWEKCQENEEVCDSTANAKVVKAGWNLAAAHTELAQLSLEAVGVGPQKLEEVKARAEPIVRHLGAKLEAEEAAQRVGERAAPGSNGEY